MNWLSKIASVFSNAVDTLVPIGLGSRTKFAVLACPALQVGKVFVPADFHPFVDTVQHVLCASAPVFALAGLVRPAK